MPRATDFACLCLSRRASRPRVRIVKRARAYLPPLRRDRGPVPEIPRRLFVQVPFPGEKSLQAMHVSAVGPAPEVAGKVARVAVAGRHPRSILGELLVRARDRIGGRRRAAARAIVDLTTRVTRQAVMTRQHASTELQNMPVASKRRCPQIKSPTFRYPSVGGARASRRGGDEALAKRRCAG